MTATLTLMPSWAQVESSAAVIWKPPSPTMTQTSSSGCANFAPIAAGSAKPIVPRPPDVMSFRGIVVLVVLGFPHLVLAHVGHDERLALGDAPEVVHHVRGVEVPGRVRHRLDVAHRRVALELGDVLDPRLAVALGATTGTSDAQRLGHVADERHVDADVLVDLGGVELAVDLLGALRVRRELARHAIVEAHPERDDEVGLLDGRC